MPTATCASTTSTTTSSSLTKSSEDRTNEDLVVVNLDPATGSRVHPPPLEDLGLDHHQPFQVRLLTDARYIGTA